MSRDSEEQKRLVRELSNEMLKDKYIQDVGQKATVERYTLPEDGRAEQLREVVRDIAKDLQQLDPACREMEYMGSLTVHVFSSRLLRTTAFVPLTVIDKLPPVLGDAACSALSNSYLADTGRRMKKKRSGF